MSVVNLGTSEHSTIEGADRSRSTGGAKTVYSIFANGTGNILSLIKFQNGNPFEEVNGVFNEDLINIVIDRLLDFQAGEHASVENDDAITHLFAALSSMRVRTEKRRRRGVLGTQEK